MSGRFWCTGPEDELPIELGDTEPANWHPKTVNEALRDIVHKFGDRPALCLKRPEGEQKVEEMEWRVWTWNDYFRDIKAFGKSLIQLNVARFRIVNILGFNSPEWHISNCGSIYAGCIAAGIYATNSPEACKYISEHSRAEIIIVDGSKQLVKYTKISGELPCLKAIVVYGEPVDDAIASKCAVHVYSWEDFLRIGSDVPDADLEARADSVRPGHCSTLIYTSGTTGPPKAVMISHDNCVWTTRTTLTYAAPLLNETDRLISYLPLSHIAAQIIDIHGPISNGMVTYFAQPDALKGSLTVTLKDVRPTLFFGVPRVWEKIFEKMKQLGARTQGIKKALADWAKHLGATKSNLHQFGNSGGAPCGYGCANTLILSKIKEALGLDQCKGAYTAAAPIAVDVLNYFASLDIAVYEVFGQSECTGPHTVSFPGAWKIGYCGRPLPGTVSKIESNTGELCYRGRHIFMGYMYSPEKTAETIDDEGWLHSGDIAEFDGNDHPNIPAPSGFMRITGRIKELIITAGGENIPPVLIEQEMKAAMPAISNCQVIGDKKKFLTILLTLMTEADDTGLPTTRLTGLSLDVSRRLGSAATTADEAREDPLWQKYFNDGIKAANDRTTSRAQVIQKWALLSSDFSERGGELTPTLKLKRSVVTAKYAQIIEDMYAGSSD